MMVQERATASGSFARDSRGLLCKICDLEGKERSRGLWKRRRRKNSWSTSNNSQLQDKVLVENNVLLEDTKGSQIIGSKYKEVVSRDEERQQPSKKTRGK